MKIVRIGAIWCPGCLVMKKVWNNINKSYNLDILDLDYDMDSENVKKYNVGNVLPVVIFLNSNNEELDRLVGEQKEEKIIGLIEKYRVIE